MNYLRLDQSFELEAGGVLPGITIAYHTYGRLNADGSNVVWVCHALTANSDVVRWWPGVVGEHGVVRPEDYFIVCANILGSCYGSTGPVGAGEGVGEHGVGLSGAGGAESLAERRTGGTGGLAERGAGGAEGLSERTGEKEGLVGTEAGTGVASEACIGERTSEKEGLAARGAGSGKEGLSGRRAGTGAEGLSEWGTGTAGFSGAGDGEQPLYADFPMITIRDMVRAHILLRKHLGIEKIHLLMGGSMGGYQALEWVVQEPEAIGRLFLIATSPTESAWGIAVHTAQRLAIEADSTWRDGRPDAGQNGLKAARAIGILTYRNYGIMVQKQTDPDAEKLDGYRASSYIEYQGKKLVERFSAHSYWLLTKAMDSHNIARGRGVGAGPGGHVGTGGHTVWREDVEAILRGIRQKTLVIGITSDILCPFEEQRHLAAHLPDARLVEIDSAYGHDGFMVEGEKIASHLRDWLGE